VIPSFQAAYVINDKWSVSAQFAVGGGGGACEFEEGLPMFEELVGGKLAPQIAGAVAPYTMSQSLTGEQYFYGFQLGGTYKVADNFSVFGGLRGVLANCSYVGSISNITVNGKNAEYYTNAMQLAKAGAEQALEAGDMQTAATLKSQAEAAGTAAFLMSDYTLDCAQSGFGITPIIGLDWNLGKLNLAAKYEFRTKLEYENESENSANVDAAFADYKDGAKVRNDVPAILTLGAEYSVLPSLRVAAGYTHYFDNDAKGSTTNVSDNTWEASFGVEYDINDKWLVSAGVRHTNYGFADNELSDMNFNMDNYALGIGGAYKVNEKVTVNAGYMHSFYSDHKTPANAVGLATIYERKNDTWGVGVDIKF
jgi:long-subunit fatty acid transport protein